MKEEASCEVFGNSVRGLLNTAVKMGGTVRGVTSQKPANDFFLSLSSFSRATLSADHWGGCSTTERASKGGEEEETHAEGPHSRGIFGKTSPPASHPGYRAARTGGWMEQKPGVCRDSVGRSREQRIEDFASKELRG